MTAEYRGLVVNTVPPPCEGFQFLLTLRILERFDFGGLEHNGTEHLDPVWRAIRLAAGERIAHNNPTPAKLAAIMSDANVERLAARCATASRSTVRPSSGPRRGPHAADGAPHHVVLGRGPRRQRRSA